MVLHKARALYEHTARPTGWIKDAPGEGLDDLNDQFDDGCWGEELAALLPFGHGELAQEILVDFAEDISLDIVQLTILQSMDALCKAVEKLDAIALG